ncbi:MAG TPA: hypothetical protein VF306_14390 [Pirellulales bacterium]
MTTSWQPRVWHGRKTLRLGIVAYGTAALTARELDGIRHPLNDGASPGLGPRFHRLKPQFLKHSEEQTLAALAATSAAFDRFDLTDNFGPWAIVSSTRYLARDAFAAVIDKYRVDGPWGVSVQTIPHGSPHAVASTLSLALGIHGPCIGVGAAAGDEPQALLSAASLLRDPKRPGAWLVFTAWSPESPPNAGGSSMTQATCLAAALAVVNLTYSQARVIGEVEFSIGECDEALPRRVDDCRSPVLGLTEFLVGWHNDQRRWQGRAGAEMQIALDRPSVDEPIAARAGSPADQRRRAA